MKIHNPMHGSKHNPMHHQASNILEKEAEIRNKYQARIDEILWHCDENTNPHEKFYLQLYHRTKGEMFQELASVNRCPVRKYHYKTEAKRCFAISSSERKGNYRSLTESL